MMKRLLIFIGLAISLSTAKAQFIAKDSSEKVLPKLSLKYFPSQLVSHFPAQVFGAEYLLSNQIGVEARFGKLIDQNTYEYDHIYYFNKSGFKSSLMFKFYMDKSEYRRGILPFVFNVGGTHETFNPYFGIELFFNKMQYERERTFELSCGPDCSYFSKLIYGLEQQRKGLRFQLGFVSQIYGPVFLDCSIGLGVMGIDLTTDERKPKEYEYQYGYRLEEDPIQPTLPAVDFNAKLMFRIFK